MSPLRPQQFYIMEGIEEQLASIRDEDDDEEDED
jgi:hypothetical protein